MLYPPPPPPPCQTSISHGKEPWYRWRYIIAMHNNVIHQAAEPIFSNIASLLCSIAYSPNLRPPQAKCTASEREGCKNADPGSRVSLAAPRAETPREADVLRRVVSRLLDWHPNRPFSSSL